MINLINGIFNDLGLSAALNLPYFTPKVIVVMLAFVFAFECFFALVEAIFDLCKR